MFPLPRSGEDKARERKRIREKHLKRRLKGKDKHDIGEAPTLGGSNSDSDEDGSADDGDGSESDADRYGVEGSDSSDQSNDSGDGMGDSSSDGESSSVGEEGKGRDVGARKRHRAKAPTGASLEEQEDAVLQMLAARQGR